MMWTATLTAALMMAHQVAGKAVRDSFFLTNHPATALPRMVMAASALTIVFVLLFTRGMKRFGPRRLVPAGFLFSALAHLVEYRFAAQAPAAWSVLVYVHIVGLGAILLSGFWSQMSESFDPRSAKQVFGHITGGGTVGGIAGGLLAERVAAYFPAASVIALLGVLHLMCSLALALLRPAGAAEPEQEGLPSPQSGTLLRRAPYLVTIAAVVMSGTAAAAIVDYLFKAGASGTFGGGAPLLRFFAAFYTATQVLTFLAQTLLSQAALRGLGIGRTICALPGGVALGSLGALMLPVFPAFAVLRSLEFGLRGSLYRSGYELLYTPVPPAEKRTAKTLIDVGCDRAGDVMGSALVQCALWLGGDFLNSSLLGATLLIGAVGAWAALRLDAIYAGLVRQRLLDRAVEMDLDSADDWTTRTLVLTRVEPRAGIAPSAVPEPHIATRPPADPVLGTLRELRSEDCARVLAAIGSIERPDALLASQLLRLLAWDEVSGAAAAALLKDPCSIAGMLIDHLTDPASPFGVRRRIPRLLGRCERPLAVEGLLAGLADPRFEVRFQCSRALDALHQRRPDLRVDPAAVFAAVERELQAARPVWDSRRLLDRRDSADPEAFFDEVLQERASQSLEHVFSLFAAVLPREPVKVAFRALHTEDPALRGLAAEYLDGVLPPAVRQRLWALLDPAPTGSRSRPPEQPLDELLRSQPSLLIQLHALKPKP